MSDLIGYCAAFCTTFAFVPQVVLVVRSGNTQGISLGMYTIFCTGVALWLCYGLMLADVPIIAANALTLFLALIVLGYKIRNTLKERHNQSTKV